MQNALSFSWGGKIVAQKCNSRVFILSRPLRGHDDEELQATSNHILGEHKKCIERCLSFCG
jgi:hypothetical protein